jgi:general secretion pathway protein G
MRLRHVEQGARVAVRAGFTLMELLVVVAILLVLVGVATPMYMRYLEESKVRVARTDCVRLAGELKNYYVLKGDYPQGMPVLDTLVAEGYMERLPLDPWHMPYQWTLKPVGIDGLTSAPIVWSSGPNRNSENGGGDDITSE